MSLQNTSGFSTTINENKLQMDKTPNGQSKDDTKTNKKCNQIPKLCTQFQQIQIWKNYNCKRIQIQQTPKIDTTKLQSKSWPELCQSTRIYFINSAKFQQIHKFERKEKKNTPRDPIIFFVNFPPSQNTHRYEHVPIRAAQIPAAALQPAAANALVAQRPALVPIRTIAQLDREERQRQRNRESQ